MRWRQGGLLLGGSMLLLVAACETIAGIQDVTPVGAGGKGGASVARSDDASADGAGGGNGSSSRSITDGDASANGGSGGASATSGVSSSQGIGDSGSGDGGSGDGGSGDGGFGDGGSGDGGSDAGCAGDGRVQTGGTDYYSTANLCGTFDYDNDGLETKQPAQLGPTSCGGELSCTYNAATGECDGHYSNGCTGITYSKPACGVIIEYSGTGCALGLDSHCLTVNWGGSTGIAQACR